MSENEEEAPPAEDEKPTEEELPPAAAEKTPGFTVLGADITKKKPEAKRVLPKWLLQPTVIPTNLKDLKSKVTKIKSLDQDLRDLLKQNGVKYFFPVQAAVIPYILESRKHADVMPPRDICVSSPTGSGKTLAFVLPLVQILRTYTIKKVRALVILPTQDLAIQVHDCFKQYTKNSSVNVCLISKKEQFAEEQTRLVRYCECFGYISKTDIIVCTAGRLVDHLKHTKGLDLKSLEFLVIDEADKVLNSMQSDWLYHLEKHIYEGAPNQSGNVLNLITIKNRKPLQKLLFSATLSQDPEKLQQISTFQPKLFTAVIENNDNEEVKEGLSNETFIGKYTTPMELTEKFIVTPIELKPLVLYKFIKNEKLTQTLVFTHSIESVHRLKVLLQSLSKNSLKVEEISSSLLPKDRSRLIEKFSNQEIDVLVSTDALARGMDLPKVQCVISFSAPKFIKTYIHRAGRTARAGEQGLAVTLLHDNQVTKFKSLLNQAGKTNVEEVSIPEDSLEDLGDLYQEAIVKLKTTVNHEQASQRKKTKSIKHNYRTKRKRTDSV